MSGTTHADLDSLVFEVEQLTGTSIAPIVVDERIYKFTVPAVLLFLVITRPSFLYTEVEKTRKFSLSRLVVSTILISLLCIGGYVLSKKYRVL